MSIDWLTIQWLNIHIGMNNMNLARHNYQVSELSIQLFKGSFKFCISIQLWIAITGFQLLSMSKHDMETNLTFQRAFIKSKTKVLIDFELIISEDFNFRSKGKLCVSYLFRPFIPNWFQTEVRGPPEHIQCLSMRALSTQIRYKQRSTVTYVIIQRPWIAESFMQSLLNSGFKTQILNI